MFGFQAVNTLLEDNFVTAVAVGIVAVDTGWTFRRNHQIHLDSAPFHSRHIVVAVVTAVDTGSDMVGIVAEASVAVVVVDDSYRRNRLASHH